MISEALELRVEFRRVNHSWCKCVVSHCYGDLGGTGMEVVDGMHAGKIHGVGGISGDSRALLECQVID